MPPVTTQRYVAFLSPDGRFPISREVHSGVLSKAWRRERGAAGPQESSMIAADDGLGFPLGTAASWLMNRAVITPIDSAIERQYPPDGPARGW